MPVLTELGNPSSSFGSSVACSAPDSNVGHSWFAVGAPDENSGEGRVYIVKPSGIVTTLQSNAPGSAKNFGAAVTFFNDINGDSISDLAIGEPNPSGINGALHVFLSTGNGAAPFAYCASLVGAQSYASHIFSTSKQGVNSAQLVISRSASGAPGIESQTVSYNTFTGLCQFSADGAYGSTGAINSRYGHSVAEINDGSLNPTLLIGAPGLVQGGLFVEPEAGVATLTFSGISGGNFGSRIAASFNSSLFSVAVPRETNSLLVKHQAPGVYTSACSLQVPMNNLSTLASHSLAHLGLTFASFVGDVERGTLPEAVFASYRDEADTGGSVVMFGAHALNGCSVPKQLNNCALDVNQKQGMAIAGGSQCEALGGAKVILVGSPGFAGNQGRIDIYEEGTGLASALPCIEPTSTPAPSPTPIATPVITATATPGFGGTPIEVGPRTSGLPAPIAEVIRRRVVLVAPRLMSKRPRFLGYVWTIRFGRASRSAAMMYSLTNRDMAPKKREIFSRRERISLRNLAPGTYAATYRPVFQSPESDSRKIFGKFSAQGTFRIR
jgi:hypothetical protein